MVEQLVQNAPSIAVVVIAQQDSMDYVRQAMLAGARGFIVRPLDREGLINTLRQIGEVERQRKVAVERETPRNGLRQEPGHVIALSSLKGGVGRTFLATNLAIALQSQGDDNVVLMEGPSGGDLAVMLNLRPAYTVVDLLPQLNMMDADLITGALTRHDSGLEVLPFRVPGQSADDLTLDDLFSVVGYLQRLCSYVVLDIGPVWAGELMQLLQAVDTLLIVAVPEMPSLRRAAIMHDQALALGFPKGRLHLIVNRADAEGGVGAKDIAHHLRIPNPYSIPSDPCLASHSINRGIPFVVEHAQNRVAKRIVRLADEVKGLMPQVTDTQLPALGMGRRLVRMFGVA